MFELHDIKICYVGMNFSGKFGFSPVKCFNEVSFAVGFGF